LFAAYNKVLHNCAKCSFNYVSSDTEPLNVHPRTQVLLRMTPLRLLILAVVISGIGPVLVRESPVGPAATAFWRLAIPLPFAIWFARTVWRMGYRDVVWALISGFLLATDLVCWNNAILKTSVMEATVLVMLFPIIVAVGEISIFGRQLRRQLLVGGLIAFLGTAVITLGASRGESNLTGDLLALAAAIFYAVSLLIAGQLCRRNNPSGVTFWVMLGAALGALPVAMTETKMLPVNAYELVYLTMYGVLTFAGYTLYNMALSKLPTTLVAISGYGQPVIATALAMVLLSEVPSLTSVLGGAVVIAGLLIATINQNHNAVIPAPPEP
jgi:drug/metabolite transporter (DMT)-like permease